MDTSNPEKSLSTICDFEFDLCKYHTNQLWTDGYLANTQHSIIQQVIRQDPICYRYTVGMRADHEWRLLATLGAAQWAQSMNSIVRIVGRESDEVVQAVHLFDDEIPIVERASWGANTR